MFSSHQARLAQKPMKSHGFSARLVCVEDPGSLAAEAYRTLRAELLLRTLAEPSPRAVTIVVTSPSIKEDSSTVCANLGAVLAQTGKKVSLIDCDLLRSEIHQIFGLSTAYGTADVLAGRRSLQDDIFEDPLPNLRVLTAGTTPALDTREIFDVRRLRDFYAGVSENSDYMLVNASPIGSESDSLIFAAEADAVLLTVDAQQTSKAEVQRSVRSLEAIGAPTLGTVVSNVKSKNSLR